jgi:hypothetical protein
MLKSIYEKLLVAGMLFVMASCAHKLIMSEITPGSGVTSDFVSFLDDFNALAKARVDGYCQPSIDVGFGNLRNMDPQNKDGGRVIGLCIPTSRPMVLFDREFWQTASDIEKEMLAYHEFGHCILDLGHDESLMEVRGRKQPTSLMYPHILSQYQYVPMQDYYITELFSSSEKTSDTWKESCSNGEN